MANITREYETNKVIKMMITCEDGTDYVDIINNGEDKGNYKYSLIDNPDDVHPYIELLITELEYCYSTSSIRRKCKMTSPSIAPRYVFSSVSNDDLIEGKACFFTNTISSTISSKTNAASGTYVSPVLQSNIDDTTGKKVWGIIFQDSTGHNNIIQGGTTANVAIPYASIQGGGNPGTMYQSIISMLAGWQGATSKCIGQIKSTLPIASSLSGALKYINNGDESDLLNKDGGTDDEVPAEDRTTVLYYNDRVSVTTFGFNDTTDYFTHSIQFKIQYKTNAGEKITEPRNSIVGYVKSSVDPVTFSNIEWVYNKNVKIVDCKWSYGLVGGTKHTGTKPPNNIPEIMCFYDQAQIDNKVYKAKFGTNMVIFANKSDADRFADGDKTVRPLYDGHSGRFDDTGDIGDKYSYNTQSYTIDNDMSSVWILTKEQLNELASVLATGLTKSEAESGQTLLNITKTTARSFTAQAEPVDMICDLFWVPIDVSEFCVTHTDHLQFGQDTYGAAGALDEFVDETTGQVVKAARTSSRSIEALTGGIFETIGSVVSDSKLNVRSESVTPPPSNT